MHEMAIIKTMDVMSFLGPWVLRLTLGPASITWVATGFEGLDSMVWKIFLGEAMEFVESRDVSSGIRCAGKVGTTVAKPSSVGAGVEVMGASKVWM